MALIRPGSGDFEWPLGPRGDRHIRNYAFRNVIPLGAREFAQQSESKKCTSDEEKSCKTEVVEAFRRESKIFSHPPHGPAGKLGGHDGPNGNIKPALLRTFIAGGAAGARGEVEHCGNEDRHSENIVKLDIKVVDDPSAGEEIDEQPGQIDGEGCN